MNRLQHLPWLRILAEGIAIVVSILLAFGIQAWWEHRQIRIEERAALSALLGEFRELKAEHEWVRQYNLAMRDSIRTLTSAAVGPENTLDDQAIDRLLADLYWNQELAPWSAPVLSSLVSSGDLELISDPALRQQLGAWPVKLQNVQDILQRDLDFYNDRQMPLLAESVPLAQLINADDGPPGHPENLYDNGRQIELKTTESNAHLLESRAFQNMLVQRDVYITDILFISFHELPENLDATIALLEQELAAAAGDSH